MKTITIVVAALLMSIGAMAQQQPIYNHYYLNQSLYNPASTGLGDQVTATLLHKQYLTGFTANPRTTFLSLNGPLKENKMGVGINFYSDNLGITKRSGFYGAYAYNVQLADNQFLSAGINLGMLQFSVNPDQMVVDNTEDPLLLNKNYSGSAIDGSFGLNYRFKELEVGLGANQLFGTSTKLADEINYNLERNYFATASYRFYVDGAKDFSLTPVVMARFANSEMPQEGALVLGYKDMVWVAPSYKSTGAFGFTASFLAFDGLKVGYSYETAATNNGQTYQNASHEVMVSYSFTALSKSLRQQQKKIDELDEVLQGYMEDQAARDALQDKITEEMVGDVKQNAEDIEKNKAELEALDTKLEEQARELKELKTDLVNAGLLKTENASEFGAQEKGYYIVVSSIHDKNYRESAMQSKYLSKGYQKIYNSSTGWHYVYKVKTDELPKAVEILKETRAGDHSRAWIFILQ